MEKDQNEKGFQGSESEEYYEDSNSKIYLRFQWPQSISFEMKLHKLLRKSIL